MSTPHQPESNEPADPTADIEQYLAREADPDRVRTDQEYVEQANADRAAVLKTFIDEGVIENELADRKNYPGAKVLPLLDDKGRLAHPLGDLMSNRLGLHKGFVKESERRQSRINEEDLSAEQRLLASIFTAISSNLGKRYYTDYAILQLVANYVHGLWSPRNSLKKMSQAEILRDTDETTEIGVESRDRRLRALDILVPEGGYDFTKPLSAEEVIELAEEMGKHGEHVINHQVRTTIYRDLINPPEEGRPSLDLSMKTHREHDDFKEFAKLVSVVGADDTGELVDLFEYRINAAAERLGIDEEVLWDEIDLIRVFADIYRRNLAAHHSE